MPGQELSLVLRHVRGLIGAPSGTDSIDADLLERFATRREEAAFAAVLERHGPLVLGVCRRVLGDAHDAEDAFQATFLVFARRAASIRRGASLSSWLHGVAYRVALEARTRLARRRRHERQAATLPRYDSPEDDSWAELRPLLDEELNHLPEKYRAPLVLHYLEGRTKQDAARQLGWTEGTVSGRLDRARKLLRERLVRRGVSLTAGAVAAALSQPEGLAALPAALQAVTLSAALGRGTVAPQVASLAEGTLRAVFVARLKLGAALFFLVGVLAAGTGLAIRSVPSPSPAEAGQPFAAERDPPPLPPPAPPVPDDPDDEGPRMKDRAIEKLEAVAPERWEASWKEDLDATGQPAGEILRQQVRKLGLTLETTPAQERALAQPLHLKLRGRPRLELVEEVCRSFGLYPVYPDGTTRSDAWNRTLRLEEGPRKLPITFAGPFLVEAENLKEFAPSATGEMRVRFLAVGLPPAVALPLHHGEGIALTKVAGPQGGNLIDAGRGPSWTGSETYEGYDISQYVYLKGLVRGAGDRLTVEGRLRVPITTRVETLRFEELKPGTSRTAGDVQVTLQAITPMRRISTFIMGVQQQRQDFDFRFRNTDLFRLEFVAHDADGRLLRCGLDNGSQGYRLIGFPRPPATITAKVMAELRHIDYAFRLENVPRPAHEKMPEKLEPATFPGHAAPVTVEVVKLLPDEHPAAVELRVVNHSDKDIRKLHLELTYLGAGDGQLKDWPAIRDMKSAPDQDVPVLLGRGQAEVFRVSAFSMPPGTKAVRAVPEQVEFTDATEWKAPAVPGERQRSDR